MLNSLKGLMLTLASTFRLFSIVWFLLKVYAVILVIFWVRGTFPRLRIDQLMAFAWKLMVPLSFYAIVITAVYQFYRLPGWSLTLMSLAGLAVVGYLVYQRMMAPVRRVAEVKARQEQLLLERKARREEQGRLVNAE